MDKFKLIVKVCFFIVVIGVVSNWIEFSVWKKSEGKVSIPEISISKNNTINEIILKYQFNDKQKRILTKNGEYPLNLKLLKTSLTIKQWKQKIQSILVLQIEQQSKNWNKIMIKFFLWTIFFFYSIFLIRKKKVHKKNRKWIYFISFTIFGIVLGADPAPMGTVKDAIVLWGEYKVFFIPRLIAMGVFLFSVFWFNKWICGWGCQIGTLQDFFYRLNTETKKKPIIPVLKIPFWFRNSIRILFFILFTYYSYKVSVDLIEVWDPFKLFKMSKFSLYGGITVFILLIISVFIYRPWCTLFCPFGLTGWFIELFSRYKPVINTSKCIRCKRCVKSCPSNAMEGFYENKKCRADCFSCATCVEKCPVDAIQFE